MSRNLLVALALIVAGHNASAAVPVFCPQGTEAETQITVTVKLTPNSSRGHIYTATEFYGSSCYPYVTMAKGFDDFPPTPDAPSEADRSYPVGTTVRFQTPWIDIPGATNRQSRRTTEFERTANGGCTWAGCASPNWDRTFNGMTGRVRPDTLDGNDDRSGN